MRKGIRCQTRADRKSNVPKYVPTMPEGVRCRYGVPIVEEKEEVKETPRPVWWCPRCGSSQTYYRFKTNTQRCRACGYEWERGDLRKNEESCES